MGQIFMDRLGENQDVIQIKKIIKKGPEEDLKTWRESPS